MERDGFSVRCISTSFRAPILPFEELQRARKRSCPPIERIRIHRTGSPRRRMERRDLDGRLTLTRQGICPKLDVHGTEENARSSVHRSAERKAPAKKKRRGSLQTRLKLNGTPHNNSECGKVWCNVESSLSGQQKKGDPELTRTRQVGRKRKCVACSYIHVIAYGLM